MGYVKHSIFDHLRVETSVLSSLLSTVPKYLLKPVILRWNFHSGVWTKKSTACPTRERLLRQPWRSASFLASTAQFQTRPTGDEAPKKSLRHLVCRAQIGVFMRLFCFVFFMWGEQNADWGTAERAYATRTSNDKYPVAKDFRQAAMAAPTPSKPWPPKWSLFLGGGGGGQPSQIFLDLLVKSWCIWEYFPVIYKYSLGEGVFLLWVWCRFLSWLCTFPVCTSLPWIHHPEEDLCAALC